MKSVLTVPAGGLRIVKLAGAAGVTTLDLRPQHGWTWTIILCYGYHDDTSSRTLSWNFLDGINTINSASPGAIAANVRQAITVNNILVSSNLLTSELRIHNGTYAQLTADALTAGKKLYIEALVAEYGALN